MTLLDMNVEGVPDLEVVAPNEYELKIVSAKVQPYNTEKGKGNMVQLVFAIPSEELAKPFYHTLFMPNEKDNELQVNDKKRRFKGFFEAFDMPLSGQLELEEMAGMTGWAFLKIQAATDEYEEKNFIAKWQPSH